MVSQVHPSLKRFEFDSGPIPFEGGLLIPITNNWPRTCLEAVGTSFRTAHDVDGDFVNDTILTTKPRFIDVNNDGLIQREVDGLHLRVVQAEAIQPDQGVECGPEHRTQAIQRVISGL